MGSCRPQAGTPLKTHPKKNPAARTGRRKPPQTPKLAAACYCQPPPASQRLKRLLIRLGRFLTAERQQLADKQPLAPNPVKERQSSPPRRVQHGSSPRDYPPLASPPPFFPPLPIIPSSPPWQPLHPPHPPPNLSVPRSHFTLTSPVRDLAAEQKAFLHTLSQAV